MNKRNNREAKIIYGSEPVWDDVSSIKEDIDVTIERAFSWYWNVYRNDSMTHKKWVIEYSKGILSKDDVKFLKSNSSKLFSSMGHHCRMMSLGAPLSDKIRERVISSIRELVLTGKKTYEDKLSRGDIISVQDRIKKQVSEYLFHIEIKLDESVCFIKDGSKVTFSIERWLIDNKVKSAQAKMISEWFCGLSEELKITYFDKEPQLVEGYNFLTRTQLKKYMLLVQDIVSTCDRYATVVQVSKTTRRKKQKSPKKMVSSVKFLNDDEELKIKSVPPLKIIGAKKIWIYNVKYRTITYYVCDVFSDGLSVKGTTVCNFDKENSKSRKVRKPELYMKNVQSLGKRAMDNKYKQLKTKESIPTGRLNGNCVILGAV